MDKQTFEQRKQARIDRLKARAARLASESDSAYDRAKGMASVIPFGQPILVGHHSEGRDRRYRGKIENLYRKSFELDEEAQAVARRAAAAESNRAISSDDPEAVQQLKAKLAAVESARAKCRETNRLLRAGDDEALRKMGYSDSAILKLKTPSWCGKIGYPPYVLSNYGGQITQIKKRIAELERKPVETKEYTSGAVKVVENADENRIQLFFPGKPEEKVRDTLKSYGFRWSPFNGCWQRQLTGSAKYAVQAVLKTLEGGDKDAVKCEEGQSNNQGT